MEVTSNEYPCTNKNFHHLHQWISWSYPALFPIFLCQAWNLMDHPFSPFYKMVGRCSDEILRALSTCCWRLLAHAGRMQDLGCNADWKAELANFKGTANTWCNRTTTLYLKGISSFQECKQKLNTVFTHWAFEHDGAVCSSWCYSSVICIAGEWLCKVTLGMGGCLWPHSTSRNHKVRNCCAVLWLCSSWFLLL